MKVELRGVSKRLGGHVIFADLSASLEFQHTLALIGPSGGGKSTLLRLLAGLLVPDSGSILFDGEPLPADPAGLRAHRSRLGIVFQAWNLFPHLSALDNICLPLTAVHGHSRPSAEKLARAVLARFQLSAHVDKSPAALSGGQCQRVAIARAVAIQPKVLLLDEPTSALDPEMTAEVLVLLDGLRSGGCPQILVTHAMGFARQAADNVAFLADGRIIESGEPSRFFSQPATDAARRFLEKVQRY
jgi:polar amino acid transport system ATP-binding protein